MAMERTDVQSLVSALFTLIAGIERASRLSRGATALRLLQVVAELQPVRPSALARRQQVHASLVTRQLQDLADTGYVAMRVDPADRRSRQVALTPAGIEELNRLQQVGIDRFALFVADWEPEEVRTLTALLTKLEHSKAAAVRRERSGGATRADAHQ